MSDTGDVASALTSGSEQSNTLSQPNTANSTSVGKQSANCCDSQPTASFRSLPTLCSTSKQAAAAGASISWFSCEKLTVRHHGNVELVPGLPTHVISRTKAQQRCFGSWSMYAATSHQNAHYSSAGFTTSASLQVNNNRASSVTPKRLSKRAQLPQKHLDMHPPGSEKWLQWVAALCSVPHVQSRQAELILHSKPLLLTLLPGGVTLRLARMYKMLAAQTDLSEAEFAYLLQTCPSAVLIQVEQALAALEWYASTFTFDRTELGRLARCAPVFLAYSRETLQIRLGVLLGQNLSIADVRDCIMRHPRLLVFNPSTLVSDLDKLCSEFGCTEKYVLMCACYTLHRKPERMFPRAAFLRYLGLENITIHQVWAARTDTDFAEIKVRSHLKRTGKSLAQLCAAMQQMPGMEAAMALAALSPNINTPLQCLTAFSCLYKSQALVSAGHHQV